MKIKVANSQNPDNAEWITLPASESELDALLSKLGADGNTQFVVVDADNENRFAPCQKEYTWSGLMQLNQSAAFVNSLQGGEGKEIDFRDCIDTLSMFSDIFELDMEFKAPDFEAEETEQTVSTLEEGVQYDRFKTNHEGGHFTVDGGGALLMVYMPKITAEERCRIEGKFEIRFVTINEVTMILYKIGNLPWMDTPVYKAWLQDMPEDLQIPDDADNQNTGLSLTVHVIDTQNGEVVKNRLIGLGHDFSIKLVDAIKQVKDLEDIHVRVTTIYNKYKTTDLVKLAKYYDKSR